MITFPDEELNFDDYPTMATEVLSCLEREGIGGSGSLEIIGCGGDLLHCRSFELTRK